MSQIYTWYVPCTCLLLRTPFLPYLYSLFFVHYITSPSQFPPQWSFHQRPGFLSLIDSSVFVIWDSLFHSPRRELLIYRFQSLNFPITLNKKWDIPDRYSYVSLSPLPVRISTTFMLLISYNSVTFSKSYHSFLCHTLLFRNHLFPV